MNEDYCIRGDSSNWEADSIENVDQSPPMDLYVLEHQLEVCSIPVGAVKDFTHALIKIVFLPESRPAFFSFTQTSEDCTIIVPREDFEDFPKHDKIQKSTDPWRALAISVGETGATELAGVSKIARNVICPLADKGISVLVLTTYQSDYILVQEPLLKDAVACLTTHFNVYDECGERIMSPASNIITGKSFFTESVKRRPDVSSLVSSQSYYISSLNSALFQSVLQVLLELMFYSSRPKSDHFFHYSMIEGDSSMILDSNALSRFPSSALHTSSDSDTWRMINIGDEPFDFDTYGVVASVAEPLAEAGLSTYYISTYKYGHTLVSSQDLDNVLKILQEHKENEIEIDEDR